jgi:hypothetical protein
MRKKHAREVASHIAPLYGLPEQAVREYTQLFEQVYGIRLTAVTRRLLEHWRDETAREHPFYFCQLEAIETLIWWVEGAHEYRQGIFVPGDGGLWERLCNKMATGAGKTTVMAMIITWQVLNALTYPKRNKDFSKTIFIVAPGLTVKDRLRVLYTGGLDNYYDEFGLCPSEAGAQRMPAPGQASMRRALKSLSTPSSSSMRQQRCSMPQV